MPASGRFQSRLLSYLSQQRLRLGDRTSRWFRHAANAVALGAQVVLYPVYVAFQSARLAGGNSGKRGVGLVIGQLVGWVERSTHLLSKMDWLSHLWLWAGAGSVRRRCGTGS